MSASGLVRARWRELGGEKLPPGLREERGRRQDRHGRRRGDRPRRLGLWFEHRLHVVLGAIVLLCSLLRAQSARDRRTGAARTERTADAGSAVRTRSAGVRRGATGAARGDGQVERRARAGLTPQRHRQLLGRSRGGLRGGRHDPAASRDVGRVHDEGAQYVRDVGRARSTTWRRCTGRLASPPTRSPNAIAMTRLPRCIQVQSQLRAGGPQRAGAGQ